MVEKACEINQIIRFKILFDCKIKIIFHDNFEGVIDLKTFLSKGFAKELLAKEKFEQVFIEDGGGLAWPNGFDICPNHLRKLVEEKQSVA